MRNLNKNFIDKEENIEYMATINPDIAELCGIILGDGHIHTKFNRITISGSLEDIFYYNERVIPLFKRNFKGVNPRLSKRRNENSYFLEVYSKHMLNYFIRIGLKRGSKINAKIPNIIKNNNELIPHFLRGLFDTDGCLKFSKQTKGINYYPRIQYCFMLNNFSKGLSELFSKLKFRFGTWVEKRGTKGLLYYHISGKNNLERWMKIVGMNNPVHKSKYLFWKKYGYYMPKSSLKERIKMINIKDI